MGYNRSISQIDIFNVTKPVVGGSGMSASLEERNINSVDPSTKDIAGAISSNGSIGKKYNALSSIIMASKTSCTICHVPYSVTSIPFSVKMKKCAICNKGRVPDVLLATLEVPDCVQVTGMYNFIIKSFMKAQY